MWQEGCRLEQLALAGLKVGKDKESNRRIIKMKAAVVYWSGTGNTAAMADLVLEGMQSAGAQADLIECTAVADLSP